jgi:hypothetical protein
MTHAAWQENRGGELYFVEADRTAAGWVFSERSTYEARWFTVAPKSGWIERAERSAAKANAKGQDGGHGVPRPASKPEVEVGDFHDNAAVLTTAAWRIDNGEITAGLRMLYVLQDHIAATNDVKSRIILLPAVENAIERAYRHQQDMDQPSAASQRTAPATAASPSGEGLAGPSDLASRVKSHLIDAVGVVTALCWTHAILVHEITTLPGLGASSTGAHLASVSLLAILLRLAAKGAR